MMVKFDENQILKNGEYIYAQRAEIEKIADAVCEKGFDNILFTSSGGSLAMMQPFDYMISVMSNLNVQSQISAELLVEGNNHLTDKTLVFMASKSGDTKETVAAAKYVKEKGATIVSVLGVDNSPMGELSDYSVVYKDGRPQEYVLYMLIGKLLENKGFFDDYIQDDNTQNALLNGEASVAFLYTSQVTAALAENPDLKVVYPEEGLGFGIMGMFIPSEAPDKDAAYSFMDYIMQPEVAAKCTDYIGYYSTNKAADELVNPDLVVPDDVTKGEIVQNVSQDADAQYQKNWTEFKAACD